MQKIKTNVAKVIKKDATVVRKAMNEAPVRIYDHITGDRFSHAHKLSVGVILMTVGVTLSKTGGHVTSFIIVFLSDAVGYLIHGIGCIPIADYLRYRVQVMIEQAKVVVNDDATDTVTEPIVEETEPAK